MWCEGRGAVGTCYQRLVVRPATQGSSDPTPAFESDVRYSRLVEDYLW